MANGTRRVKPSEQHLLEPVLALFGTDRYEHCLEVPLGWKQIDVLCIGHFSSPWISVELKVRDWKKALEQAAINHILVDHVRRVMARTCLRCTRAAEYL